MGSKRLTFIEAKALSARCVYVFLDGSTPVYIGKTKNTNKRFEPYKSKSCHNESLNNWLSLNNCNFFVDVYEVEDIDSLEVSMIDKYSGTLFNLSKGGNNDWLYQSRDKKPWVAGRGILSPISKILRKMPVSDRKDTIKKWLSTLTDKERCIEELSIAMKTPTANKRWLDITSKKLILAIGG